MKKNLERVELDGAELGVDFTLVSDTDFNADEIKHVFSIDGLDAKLATMLGLGIVREIGGDELFLYNAMYKQDGDKAEDHGYLRLGIYYQIMYPQYIDTKLDILVNQTKGSEKYLRSIFAVDTDEPIIKLKEIFKAQKGKENNVVKFKK